VGRGASRAGHGRRRPPGLPCVHPCAVARPSAGPGSHRDAAGRDRQDRRRRPGSLPRPCRLAAGRGPGARLHPRARRAPQRPHPGRVRSRSAAHQLAVVRRHPRPAPRRRRRQVRRLPRPAQRPGHGDHAAPGCHRRRIRVHLPPGRQPALRPAARTTCRRQRTRPHLHVSHRIWALRPVEGPARIRSERAGRLRIRDGRRPGRPTEVLPRLLPGRPDHRVLRRRRDHGSTAPACPRRWLLPGETIADPERHVGPGPRPARHHHPGPPARNRLLPSPDSLDQHRLRRGHLASAATHLQQPDPASHRPPGALRGRPRHLAVAADVSHIARLLSSSIKE
jgi:hypothetical protein